MSEGTIVAIITALAPCLVTLISNGVQNRDSKRNFAKQSILQMIMEDEFGWEAFRRLPLNYARIIDEYNVYHSHGGNGEITKKVREYCAWYNRIEQEHGAKPADTNIPS